MILLKNRFQLIGLLSINFLLLGSIVLFIVSKKTNQVNVSDTLNQTNFSVSFNDIDDVINEITYGKIEELGKSKHRMFTINFATSTSTFDTDTRYSGFEIASTSKKYILNERTEAIFINAVLGNLYYVTRCNARCGSTLLKIDIDQAVKLHNNFFVVIPQYTQIEEDEFDVSFFYNNKYIVVSDTGIVEYNLTSGTSTTLITLASNEATGHVSGFDGQSVIPEAKLEGDILSYSVYTDVRTSSNQYDKTSRASPLYNKSIILK